MTHSIFQGAAPVQVGSGSPTTKALGGKPVTRTSSVSLHTAVKREISKKKDSTKQIVPCKESTPNRVVVRCGHGKVSTSSI